jgi:DNA-binding CsgD family transcriptional regulator/PAS domain-containing protein
MDAQVLSRILEVLYEAPLDTSRWEEFLRLTAAAVRGEAAALLMHDSSNFESRMSAEWGFHPDVSKHYAAHYGAIDVWRVAVTTSPDWLGTSEQFVPSASLARTEFYNDLLSPYEIPHGMFAMVERGRGRVANLSICRSAKGGPFNEQDLEILKFLKPHIQRAYRLHSEFARTHFRTAGLVSTLDAISTGVILLGPTMRVITMNQTAERIVSENDGLHVNRGELAVEDVAESASLRKLIAEAVTTSQGAGLNSGGAITISRRDLPSLQILVSPVRGADLNSPQHPCAIVFVNDPAQRARPTSAVLRTLFDLTPAECRLASLLADGRSPHEISEMVGVSANTVKSQLSNIYSKTATSGRAALMRLLTQLAIQLPS